MLAIREKPSIMQATTLVVSAPRMVMAVHHTSMNSIGLPFKALRDSAHLTMTSPAPLRVKAPVSRKA